MRPSCAGSTALASLSFAGGGFWIGEGAIRDELDAAALSASSTAGNAHIPRVRCPLCTESGHERRFRDGTTGDTGKIDDAKGSFRDSRMTRHGLPAVAVWKCHSSPRSQPRSSCIRPADCRYFGTTLPTEIIPLEPFLAERASTSLEEILYELRLMKMGARLPN